MWKRSQVEELTGVSKRAIQQLCNHNAKTGGLAFWHPYDMGPGYAAYDEVDMLAFLLVGRLHDAGFALAEMRPAVKAMVRDAGDREGEASYAELVRAKRQRLQRELAEIEGKLALLQAFDVEADDDPRARLEKVLGGWMVRALGAVLQAMAQQGDTRAAECLQGVEAARRRRHDLADAVLDDECLCFGAEVFDRLAQEPGMGALMELAGGKGLAEETWACGRGAAASVC